MTEYPGFQLKTPCKNCPFRNDETRITFRGKERAAEISEHAYRRGFPCHLSAAIEEDEDGVGGFVFGENSQHCAGALIVFLKDSFGSPWPAINNDEELLEYLEQHLDLDAPTFDSEEEFIWANATEDEKNSDDGEHNVLER